MNFRLPHLSISLSSQRLLLHREEAVVQEFPISSSKFGTGTSEGSYQTPLGNFVINEKHGRDAPLGTLFKGRRAQGVYDLAGESEEDHILTRILRLTGVDPDNANTYQRYIYLHGTNHEQRIGSPDSYGCIRMTNQDIITLSGLVPVGSTAQIYA